MFNLPVTLGGFSEYARFYKNYAIQRWTYLTPMEYGIILISVGVLGYVLMKNASRR